jgi:phenylalanyl-tRNA synthetase alpha chain
MKNYIEMNKLQEYLEIKDLTNPLQGKHAMQELMKKIVNAIEVSMECNIQVHRKSPIVRLEDNYDLLNYPIDGAARDSRYTKYITENLILRTQTSSMIPSIMKDLSILNNTKDTLMVCPGIVYRRDVIDKLHVASPHQLDLWLVSKDVKTKENLLKMIDIILNSVIPKVEYKLTDAVHPYTTQGVQIDVKHQGQWIEVGECGLASQDVLALSGKPLNGLAMGLGLDRLLMIVKNLNDIRLIRDEDPRVQCQMLDLKKYKTVSKMPSSSKDISVAVDKDIQEEEIGALIYETYPQYIDSIEEIRVLSETPYEKLPQSALDRMGLDSSQKNLLIRIVIRSLSKTLTMEEAKEIRNGIYKTLHQGSCSETDYL